jgi:SEC-C motif
MVSRPNLEDEISAGLSELHGLIADKATWSIAGWCSAYQISGASGSNDETRFRSPAKQIPFLLGVLLSTPEPQNEKQLTREGWEKVKQTVDRLFHAYMLLYAPAEGDLGPFAPEWVRVREVSMLAFLHYFNNGLMASVEQISERITRYCAPFDAELAAALGITATQAQAVMHGMTRTLQASLDAFQLSAEAEQKQRFALLEKAARENWSKKKFEAAANNPTYRTVTEDFTSKLDGIGKVSRTELAAAFPGTGDTVWNLFSSERGEGAAIRYPTERSIAELRPLIRLSASEAIGGTGNALFTALLLVCEQTLAKSSARAKFLRLRDKTLEREVVEKIKPFLSSTAEVYPEAYERPDGNFEHDVIIVDEGLCLVIEAKASPPEEPFRDPEKAFARLRNAFRSDGGIQKGYEQANRIVRRLRVREAVSLYDKDGREIRRLIPDELNLTVGMVVTRDSFGSLATNLKLLLEKEPADAYPWAVNIIDLANLAQAWNYFGFRPNKFRHFLKQRILLHGKVWSDDELDYAGFFIRHGSFDAALSARADLFQLNPNYADIFDQVYRHLHGAGPPVTVTETQPVLTDLRHSLASGRPESVNKPQKRSSRKIGRNELCPCGSGRKHKRCCGGQ